jgi:hypothetical protein
MELPFPGMDPYLEAPSIWPDVHTSLIYEIRQQLQSQLGPQYTAVITPYVMLESIDIAPTRRAFPDLEVVDTDLPRGGGTAIVFEPAPITATVPIEMPTRYGRLEIRTVEHQILVTSIELLSPANKRPGPDGADGYHQKRQDFLQSTAHLLEIDLLRGGQRPRITRNLPSEPLYFVYLSRANNRPVAEICPLSLRAGIPLIPVPLRQPDPDIAMDLGAALRRVYAGAGYERRIDYRDEPPPPPLAPDDLAWLDVHLRECGLR